MRVPSKTSPGSRSLPLSDTAVTLGAIRSAKLAAPGSAQRNRIVVTERKVRGSASMGPTAERRSRDTSYPSTDSRAARSWASSRDRFSPGTGGTPSWCDGLGVTDLV